jgi:GAG-pre-integrase domain
MQEVYLRTKPWLVDASSRCIFDWNESIML